MKEINSSLQNISPIWPFYTPITATHGKGCIIYDEDGNEYLDFTCGIAVTNTGHCHPKVVEAIQKQAGLLIHGQVNIIRHQPLLDLIFELKTIVPQSIDSFFFSNSGAEAIEGAIKLARHATNRPNIIVFQGSFHGRTIGTMSLTTSKTIYRAGYQPLMPGVFVAPYPYTHRYGWNEEQTKNWCLQELEFLLDTQTAPQETAAILIETILGEGGYIVPPPGFLTGIRKICEKHGILLILDEIQSGFGRTGKWFAFEHFNIVPDIMTVAKGLASGMPLSGVFSSKEIMEKWIPGSHGGTYGGNAVCAAAAAATIRVMKEENLLLNAQQRGLQLMTGLRHIQEEYPCISDIRGRGLMVGSEMRDKNNQPDKKLTKDIIHRCLNKKLILLSCGPWDNTIRWIPPLIVSEEQIKEALAIFYTSLKEING